MTGSDPDLPGFRTLAEAPALERAPGAFQPIRVDRRRDRVGYEEANVWMLHRVPASRGRSRRRPARHPHPRATRPEDA